MSRGKQNNLLFSVRVHWVPSPALQAVQLEKGGAKGKTQVEKNKWQGDLKRKPSLIWGEFKEMWNFSLEERWLKVWGGQTWGSAFRGAWLPTPPRIAGAWRHSGNLLAGSAAGLKQPSGVTSATPKKSFLCRQNVPVASEAVTRVNGRGVTAAVKKKGLAAVSSSGIAIPADSQQMQGCTWGMITS